MAEGIRATPKIACTTSSLRNRSRCAKRRPPVSTVANKANAMSSTGIWLGEVRPSGNACANTWRTPRFSRYLITATSPPQPLTGLPGKPDRELAARLKHYSFEVVGEPDSDACLGIFRVRFDSLLPHDQLEAHRDYDSLHELVLHRKDVAQRALVALGPQFRAGGRIH